MPDEEKKEGLIKKLGKSAIKSTSKSVKGAPVLVPASINDEL